MGHWGSHAISNDLATDWFASVMESVAEAVDDAFAEGTPETVRAACVLLEQLGETYIWPAERMEVQLQAGIALLWEIVASEWCDGFRDPDEVRASIVAPCQSGMSVIISPAARSRSQYLRPGGVSPMWQRIYFPKQA